MKSLLTIASIFLCWPFSEAADEVPRLHDEYDPAKWPQAHLRLSQAGTLKDVFDSGLRPYRHPGVENTTLEVKHLNLTIHLASGKQLPLIVTELVNIKPFVDGEIATIEGFTPRLTLEQAREEMLKWLPYAANDRTVKDLDAYLEAAKADFHNFDDPYRGITHGCGVGWNEPGFGESGGGPKCGVGFRKTASESHPLRIYFGFDWGLNRPTKNRGNYRPEPIAPPPGYEHVDMTAPKGFGPDSGVNILRSKGVDIGDGKGGIPYNEYLASIGEKPLESFPPSAHESSTPEESSKTSFWWWLLAGIVMLTVVFGFRKWSIRADK